MICGIILLVIGAVGGVLSFLLPQVHKFSFRFWRYRWLRQWQVLCFLWCASCRYQRKKKRCVHSGYSIWKRSVSSATGGRNSKTMEEASKEASRIEQETKHFLEQYQMVPGEKDARTCLYELRSQLQEYERLRSRAGKSDAARQEFERKQNSLLAFGKEAGMDFGEDLAAGISQLQMKATEYRIAQKAYAEARKRENF